MIDRAQKQPAQFVAAPDSGAVLGQCAARVWTMTLKQTRRDENPLEVPKMQRSLKAILFQTPYLRLLPTRCYLYRNSFNRTSNSNNRFNNCHDPQPRPAAPLQRPQSTALSAKIQALSPTPYGVGLVKERVLSTGVGEQGARPRSAALAGRRPAPALARKVARAAAHFRLVSMVQRCYRASPRLLPRWSEGGCLSSSSPHPPWRSCPKLLVKRMALLSNVWVPHWPRPCDLPSQS